MLEVRLLGSVDLWDPDREVSVAIRGDPGIKVAARLALHANEFFLRERIAEDLWPGGTASSMLSSLSQGLTSIRRAFSELSSDVHLRTSAPKRSRVGLFGVSTDVARFRRYRDSGDFDNAIAAIRGRPLADLSYRAGAWADLLTQSLLEELDELLRARANEFTMQQRHEEALKLHTLRSAVDPYNQQATRDNALCLQRLGRHREGVVLIQQAQVHAPISESQTLELKELLNVAASSGESPRTDHLATPVPRLGTRERFMPTHSFDGTGGYSDSFNAILSRDIEASRTYVFRGISAKYVAPRLLHRGPGLESAQVIMLDPSASEAIRLRAIDRHSNPKYEGSSIDQLCDELRAEIARSLIALFDTRHLCRIDIALITATAVDRVELTDGSLWVSLYHGRTSIGQHFPETMRFLPSAAAYEQARLDCLRRFDIASNRIQFRRSDPDSALKAVLQGLGLSFGDKQVDALRSDATRFGDYFSAILKQADQSAKSD